MPTELRTTLLAILKGWKSSDYDPAGEEIDYLWGLVEKVRNRVAAGEPLRPPDTAPVRTPSNGVSATG